MVEVSEEKMYALAFASHSIMCALTLFAKTDLVLDMMELIQEQSNLFCGAVGVTQHSHVVANVMEKSEQLKEQVERIEKGAKK